MKTKIYYDVTRGQYMVAGGDRGFTTYTQALEAVLGSKVPKQQRETLNILAACFMQPDPMDSTEECLEINVPAFPVDACRHCGVYIHDEQIDICSACQRRMN